MVLIIPLVSKITNVIFKKYAVPFGDHFLFNIYALSMLNIIQGLCFVPLIFSKNASLFNICMMTYGMLSLVYYFIIVYQFFNKSSPSQSGTMMRASFATIISLVLILGLFTFLAVLENLV
jgi:hypothetical protein